MANITAGSPVRTAGDHDAGQLGRPVGYAVQVHAALFPALQPEQSRDDQLIQINVWRGLPDQVKVFWPGADLVPDLVSWHLSSELQHADPGNSYRAGDREFFLFAVETGGYGGMAALYGDGTEAARVHNKMTGGTDFGDDPDVAHRAQLHALVDAYCADQARRRETAKTPAS